MLSDPKMARFFSEKELVIATHNDGKAKEIAELLGPYVSKFKTSKELKLPDPEETGKTFIANAELKARSAMRHSGQAALADDSGLSVYALDGDPGIYSARWAEKEDGTRDFYWAMDKVKEALSASHDKRAAFVCVLSLAWPDGHIESFEGRVEGILSFPPKGDKGFGYDPIFVPNGYIETFAEMEPNQKHEISHRKDAFEKMVEACFLSRDA